MAVATSISLSFSTIKPEKPGRVSAVAMPGNRAAKSTVRVEAGAVILALLCHSSSCGGRFDLIIAALVHQVWSKNGDGYIVGVHSFILVIPAVCLHGLLVNFFLQLDETRDQSLRGGGAAGNVDVDGQEFIDARDNVVALFEGSTSRGAGAHRHHIFRLRHLVVK